MKFHTQLKSSLFIFIRLRAGMPLLLSALVVVLASGAAWAVPEMHDHDLISSPSGIQAQRYEFKGVVVSVDRVKRRATIKHEKVEGLMDAMTMPFLVKDDKALEEMQPGDQIVALLVSSDDGAQWLEKVVVVAKSQKEEKKNAEKTDEEGKPFWLMGTPGNQKTPPPSRFDTDPTAIYTCPMHLNYRASKPGKCPRCGMELVSAEPGITEEFRLKMEVTPKLPQPGQPLKLNFAVFNPRTGEKVKEFGLMHDRLFHLFLISQDLNDFQHIHPRRLPDGNFEIDAVLNRPGLYKVYTDIYPLEGAPQVLQTNLATAGWKGDLLGGQAVLTPDTVMTKTATGVLVTPDNAEKIGAVIEALESKPAGAIKVELTLDPAGMVSGKTVTLKYRLMDAQTGQPVLDLIPYLSAWGHMLVLSEDQTSVLHSHPEQQVDLEKEINTQRGGPQVDFDVLFPAPGNYRVWTQFLRGRQAYTVAFDVNIKRLR